MDFTGLIELKAIKPNPPATVLAKVNSQAIQIHLIEF